MFRNFKVTVVVRTLVRIGCKRTEVRATFKNVMAQNSCDDPAYFGGYITENFLAVQEGLNLDHYDIYCLVKNSFEATFLDKQRKQDLITELDTFISGYNQRSVERNKGGDTFTHSMHQSTLNKESCDREFPWSV